MQRKKINQQKSPSISLFTHLIKFQALEEKFLQLDEKSVTKSDTFQVLTLGKLDSSLQDVVEEDFVSYEAKRKIDEENVKYNILVEQFTS